MNFLDTCGILCEDKYMGNRSNVVNGLRFERLSKRGDSALYKVVVIEGEQAVGTVRKVGGTWEALNTDGEMLVAPPKRQAAGEYLRTVATKSTTALFAWEKSPVATPTETTTDTETTSLVEEPEVKQAVVSSPTPQKKPKNEKLSKNKKEKTVTPRVRIPPKKVEWKRGDCSGIPIVLKHALPEPITDHPETVSWNGKGDTSFFPASIRASVKKNQRFSCDEQYLNEDTEWSYFLWHGEELFEVPAAYFRVVKR